jgi:hypothetical protein
MWIERICALPEDQPRQHEADPMGQCGVGTGTVEKQGRAAQNGPNECIKGVSEELQN